MQKRKTAVTRSSDIGVREAYEVEPQTSASMGKPLVTAILLASGTLCLSGVAATLLPAMAGSEIRFTEPQPVAAVVRAPAIPTRDFAADAESDTVAEPILPRALERLATTAASAVARLEQRLDQNVAEPTVDGPFAFATPAPTAAGMAAPMPTSAIVPPLSSSTRVVYLVDASGSLLDSLPQVIDWLGESLDSLGSGVNFTVLFFREGQIFEAPPRGMKPGSFAAKASVWTWIQPEKGNVIPQGRSDLLGAVEVAMRYQPDELYVVSDDSFNRSPAVRGDDSAIIEGIGSRLGHAPPKVHTVQFFYRDEAGALEAIADRFDGSYTFVEPVDRNATAAGDPMLELSIVN